MRPVRYIAALVAVTASLTMAAPAAEAARVGIDVGIGLPGVVLTGPAPVVVAPAPLAYGYYGPRGYWAARPYFVGAPYYRGYYRHAYVGRRHWR
jgi:hypothetical protein